MDAEPDSTVLTVPPDRGAMSEQPLWRQHFPIDTPQDNYFSRREFTKFLVLTSFAFAVGQFWIALQNVWRKMRKTPPIARIAALDQLPVGGAVTFYYPAKDSPALLIRPADKTLVAYESLCTHLQCPVLPQVAANRLYCPCHAGYFDLATGRVLAGPARRPLSQIRLNVRGGVVYATGIQEETE